MECSYLLNFLETVNNNCWYFDTDTLLCRELKTIEHLYKEYDMYTINWISGCAVKINEYSPLKKLCELIYNLRRDPKFIESQIIMIGIRTEKGKSCFVLEWPV